VSDFIVLDAANTLCNYHYSGHYHRPVFYLKHDVSEAGFCFRLQVERTQRGAIDSDGDRIQSPKRRVLNKILDIIHNPELSFI
jgi:hypothetical protein